MWLGRDSRGNLNDMKEFPKVKVLVADHDSDRMKMTESVLIKDFNAEVTLASTFDELLGKVRESGRENRYLAAIFSDMLLENNLYRAVYPARYARTLSLERQSIILFCIFAGRRPNCFNNSISDDDEAEDPKPSGNLIEVAPNWSDSEKINALIDGLSTRLQRLPSPPLTVLNERDYPLLEQVRALVPSRDLDEGRKILAALTIRFFKCDSVEINKLAQGFSGAMVFRIFPNQQGSEGREYALKLAPWENVWKINAEVQGQNSAKDTLGVAGFTKHIPDLIVPRIPIASNGNLSLAVAFGNWVALCYDFLGGGRFGKFMDLETALIVAPTELFERVTGTYLEGQSADQTRLSVLRIILHWLGKSWYLNGKRAVREVRKLWSSDDAYGRRYAELPPYALTGPMKQLILGFLDGHGAQLGQRLLENDWKQCKEDIWNLLGHHAHNPFSGLHREVPVLLSPCHGDLNSNNVLLWLAQPDFPFLIDFPFFQLKGHALQDFARLEVEVKFALMDRQDNEPGKGPQAYDHTYSQLSWWLKLEDHLLRSAVPSIEEIWPHISETENLRSTLLLLNAIRAKAYEVQNQALGVIDPAPFFDEYLPSLLYFTLRSVGFSTLPIFKRLLAVYSVGCILKKLK
jgi:hypothetical protein